MHATICICTRNRPEGLARALESLARQEGCEGLEWEILVVDNGSEDRGCVGPPPGFTAPAPLRVEREPRPGLSHARNAGLTMARGAAVIFIDDDVTVPPGWLAAYAEGLHRYPEAAFFGGPIVARVSGGSPSWARATLAVMPGLLASLDPEREESPLTADVVDLVWGANMAFRVQALEGRLFDPGLGRSPQSPSGVGEETDLLRRLLAAGRHGMWLPQAKVDHHVDGRRCRKAKFAAFCHEVGRFEGRELARSGRDWSEAQVAALRSELRRLRWNCWTTPPWTPLERRLAALRDYKCAEGVLTGYCDTLEAAGMELLTK